MKFSSLDNIITFSFTLYK